MSVGLTFTEQHFGLSEKEYYQFKTEKPVARPGIYLIYRSPFSQRLQITKPDGSKRVIMMDRRMPVELAKIGVGIDRQDRIITHVCNFQWAYARVEHADNWGQPPQADDEA